MWNTHRSRTRVEVHYRASRSWQCARIFIQVTTRRLGGVLRRTCRFLSRHADADHARAHARRRDRQDHQHLTVHSDHRSPHHKLRLARSKLVRAVEDVAVNDSNSASRSRRYAQQSCPPCVLPLAAHAFFGPNSASNGSPGTCCDFEGDFNGVPETSAWRSIPTTRRASSTRCASSRGCPFSKRITQSRLVCSCAARSACVIPRAVRAERTSAPSSPIVLTCISTPHVAVRRHSQKSLFCDFCTLGGSRALPIHA